MVDNMTDSPRTITIRIGFELTYEAVDITPITLLIQPRLEPWQRMEKYRLSFEPHVNVEEYEDIHGNTAHRFRLPVGRSTIRQDALVSVPSEPENYDHGGDPIPVGDLPTALLRYTLPSRYCDSDRLMDFAFGKFGQLQHGFARVQAICDWLHRNIHYRWGGGSPYTSASEVISQGFGVCRDFAHTAIALCRCFNIPARYATSHLPDVGFQDSGSPMDFHAYLQVYIGHRWHTFDARFNVPRIGRIQIACGLDAVDGAFSTLYGAANLAAFQVWAYQVDPAVVRLGDPIDLTKRLDGTPLLRFSSQGLAR